jgi:hypothetical protein
MRAGSCSQGRAIAEDAGRVEAKAFDEDTVSVEDRLGPNGAMTAMEEVAHPVPDLLRDDRAASDLHG